MRRRCGCRARPSPTAPRSSTSPVSSMWRSTWVDVLGVHGTRHRGLRSTQIAPLLAVDTDERVPTRCRGEALSVSRIRTQLSPPVRSSARRCSQPSNDSAAARARGRGPRRERTSRSSRACRSSSIPPTSTTRTRCCSSRRHGAPISVRASTSGTRLRSATAARSSTSTSVGRRHLAAPGRGHRRPRPTPRMPSGWRRRRTAAPISHGAIESQSCTSSTSAANSAFSIGPSRPLRLPPGSPAVETPRSASRTMSFTGIPTIGGHLPGVQHCGSTSWGVR